MIKVTKLAKRFYNKNVFYNYDILIDEERVCLTGVNGQGKTTLFCVLAGIESVNSGQIELNGDAFSDFSTLTEHVALASDKIPFPEFLTAHQIIELVQTSWQCDWPTALIEKFNFEQQLSTLYRDLSSGNCKKLQLICAFLRNTPILLLDEPTAALEHGAYQTVVELIENYPGQVVITCHEPQLFVENGFKLQALNNEL